MDERWGDFPGGIIAVVGWLREHRHAAEYELYIHGVEPGSLGYLDGATWHHAFILLVGAPDGSRFKQEVNDVPYPGVDLHAQLLAGLLDQVRYLTYGLSNKKGTKPKPTDITGKMGNKDKIDYGEGLSIDEMQDVLSQDVLSLERPTLD